MKLNSTLMLLFILLGPSLLAQSNLTKEEFGSLICKKWKLAEVEIDGKKISTTEMRKILEQNLWEFKSDGTYKVSEQGEIYFGKWSFDPLSQMLLTDDRDGKERNKIITLTETEFILQKLYPSEVWIFSFKKI
jgi:hypothetical protein